MRSIEKSRVPNSQELSPEERKLLIDFFGVLYEWDIEDKNSLKEQGTEKKSAPLKQG